MQNEGITLNSRVRCAVVTRLRASEKLVPSTLGRPRENLPVDRLFKNFLLQSANNELLVSEMPLEKNIGDHRLRFRDKSVRKTILTLKNWRTYLNLSWSTGVHRENIEGE